VADIYLISDTHLGHDAIINFCHRPFKDVKEMDETIMENWNRTVRPQDHIYHLGDVTMERHGRDEEGFIRKMRRLNGHFRLVHGNHDHFPTEIYLEAGFEKIYGMWRGIDNLLFTHAPVHPGSMGSARANIHGHIHQHESPEPVIYKPYDVIWNPETPRTTARVQPYINVCVEWTNYRPIHLDEVNMRVRVAIERWVEKNGEDPQV